MKFLITLFLCFLIFVSCQTQPTKVQENLTMGPNVDPSSTITEDTIILDTRSLFNYTSSHLPKAYPIRWQDFSFNQKMQVGLLKKDLESIARYFALLGIAPDSHVVVVGEGLTGDGSEGRIAWMLQYLGVSNVNFATEHSVTLKRKSGPPDSKTNVPFWKPAVQSDLIATRDEIISAIGKKEKAVILDVRSRGEYLGHVPGLRVPDIGAINIDWREFIDESGKPRSILLAQLEPVGVTRDKRVIVVSAKGVRSALVTHVLRRLGYSHAANFAGGHTELLSTKKKR
ncbi:MAG: sulfurtransferase [Bdellovibrionales bacterium]